MAETSSSGTGGAGRHIALLLPSLASGGVARTMLDLAGGFVARGHRVDLVLCRADGAFRDKVPAGVRVTVLKRSLGLRARALALSLDPSGWRALLRPVLLPLAGAAVLSYLPALADWLRRERPAALLSAKTHTNLLAIWARDLAGVPLRLAVSERSNLSAELRGVKGRKWRWRHVAPLIRRAYPRADAVLAVSDGVADDLAAATGLPRDRIATMYNPVVTPELATLAREPVDHPWFAPDAPPLLLAAGRLDAQKDFPTLLRAFARLRTQRAARLMILGEGRERGALEALARDLGAAEDVALPGFRPDPFAFMARARLFVLSSAYEGLPGVLIQALACGCPVVSTDCPSGPAEILDGGRFGALVPVGDAAAMAGAIAAALDAPPDREALRARASLFAADRAVDRYLAVLLGTG